MVKLRESAEMNVTPLIDVLLVRLVIFLAALPLTQRGRRREPTPLNQSPDKTLFIAANTSLQGYR